MITTRVRVERVSDDGLIWVEPVEASSCGRCHEPGGCGNALLAKVRMASRSFCLNEKIAVQVGEILWVGVERQLLVRSVFSAYIVTTLLMLAGAGIGAWVGSGDISILIGLLLGLASAVIVNKAGLIDSGKKNSLTVIRPPYDECHQNRRCEDE